MKRVWTLAAIAAFAHPVIASAVAASPATSGTPAARIDRKAVNGTVTGVSVIPASGKAEIVIAVDSAVDVADFTLAGPNRIVLDLTGAALRMPPRFYDKVVRGGITNVRFAQYKRDVVRVVIEMDARYKYEVSRGTSEVRISVSNEKAAEFAAWHAGTPVVPGAVAAAAVSATKRDATQRDATRDAAREAARVADEREAAVTAREAAVTARENASDATRREPARETNRQTAREATAEAMLPMQQSTQPRITVTYQDADIRDVLAAFAAFSGRTIVVGKAVGGTVTAEIRDQPWDVALQAILGSQGLAAAEDANGIIAVDSYQNISSKQASEPLVTQMVQINYASASALVPTITSLLARDCSSSGSGQQSNPSGGGQVVNGCVVRGSVVADTTTNTLLITDVQSRVPDLLSYVRDLDIRTPQVAIKAKIIFVSRTDIEELGVSYDLGSNAGAFNRIIPRTDPTNGDTFDPEQVPAFIQLGGEALAGVANAGRNFQNSSALSLFYSTMIGKFSLTAFIDALQEVRLADTQAEPNIVTQDRRSARILVGEETPIRVIDAAGGGGAGGARANVTFKETGIILNVTPRIAPNRQVEMTINAEQSQLQAAAADLGFTFLKRQATTNLLVNDGETAVLGGLTITQVTTSRSGIPFLVDLPFIGRLFGETRSNEQKQDLLILITPHIVDDGEAVRGRTTTPPAAPPRGA
jgi:type IV pilus assembly protein PilQ